MHPVPLPAADSAAARGEGGSGWRSTGIDATSLETSGGVSEWSVVGVNRPSSSSASSRSVAAVSADTVRLSGGRVFGSGADCSFLPLDNLSVSRSARQSYLLSVEERFANLKRISQGLQRLLEVELHVFWSHLLHDPQVKKVLDSFLLHCTRRHDIDFVVFSASESSTPFVLPAEFDQWYEAVFRQVLLVLHRASRRVESSDAFISFAAFREWHKSFSLFSAASLTDIAVVFGSAPACSDLVHDIFEETFSALPSVRESFASFGSSLLASLTDVEAILRQLPSAPSATSDALAFLLDVAASLLALLTFTPPSIRLSSSLLTSPSPTSSLDNSTSADCPAAATTPPPLLTRIQVLFHLLHDPAFIAKAIKPHSDDDQQIRSHSTITAAAGEPEKGDLELLLGRSQVSIAGCLVLLAAECFLPSMVCGRLVDESTDTLARMGGRAGDWQDRLSDDLPPPLDFECFFDWALEFVVALGNGEDGLDAAAAADLRDNGLGMVGGESAEPATVRSLRAAGVHRLFRKWREANRAGMADFDEERLKFVEAAINPAFCAFGSEMADSDDDRSDFASSDSRESDTGAEYAARRMRQRRRLRRRQEQKLAGASRGVHAQMTEAEKANVDVVVEVGGGTNEVGRGFALRCLRYFGGDVGETVNQLLDMSGLPGELQILDKRMTLETALTGMKSKKERKQEEEELASIDERMKRQVLNIVAEDRNEKVALPQRDERAPYPGERIEDMKRGPNFVHSWDRSRNYEDEYDDTMDFAGVRTVRQTFSPSDDEDSDEGYKEVDEYARREGPEFAAWAELGPAGELLQTAQAEGNAALPQPPGRGRASRRGGGRGGGRGSVVVGVEGMAGRGRGDRRGRGHNRKKQLAKKMERGMGGGGG